MAADKTRPEWWQDDLESRWQRAWPRICRQLDPATADRPITATTEAELAEVKTDLAAASAEASLSGFRDAALRLGYGAAYHYGGSWGRELEQRLAEEWAGLYGDERTPDIALLRLGFEEARAERSEVQAQ